MGINSILKYLVTTTTNVTKGAATFSENTVAVPGERVRFFGQTVVLRKVISIQKNAA